MLPALKHGVRCEAEWCDELTFFLVWGTVVGGLTGLSLGTTVVGIRRFLHLRRARYLPTVSLCELTPQHVGRLIEVQGRVVSDSPLVGLLSQREVIGYELEIKSTRRKPGLLRRKTSTVSTTFRFFTDASLNDGTGSVHLELENALLYWPHVRATWAPEEAPDWALPAKSLHSEEDRLVRVAATERYVPHGATVFVLGKLRDTQTLVARVLSVGTERITQRALLVEGITFFTVAVLSLLLAVWLGDDAISASLQYLAELNFRNFIGNPFLHIITWIWVPFVAAGMFMIPIRYAQRLGNFIATLAFRRQVYQS